MSKPNIIVFFTDQQRWDTLGLHGNPADLTPNIDYYARRGTWMEYAFTPQPVCGPARSCLQTGLYATQTGAYWNGAHMDLEHKTLAHYFGNAGYDTAYIGKWHLDREQVVKKEARRGYDYWLAANLLEYSSDAYDTVLFDEEDNPVKLPGYRVDALTDQAIGYVAQKRDKPYFLFLSFLEPHCQNYNYSYPAPASYEERYRGKWMPPDLGALDNGLSWRSLPGYMGMVKRLDEAYGRLMDALISTRQLDNTLVLFTSDHGNHFMTRNSTCKMSGHESSIRIPMTLHGPGFTGGRVVRHMVSLVDVMPTLLAVAGITPEKVSGHSFLPLATGENVAWEEEIFVQVSETSVTRVLRTLKWKYIVTAQSDVDPIKESGADVYHEAELYDMENDQWELLNLIEFERYDPIKAQLRDKLVQMMTSCADEASPRIIPAKNIPQPNGILPQMFQPDSGLTEDIDNVLRYAPKWKN